MGEVSAAVVVASAVVKLGRFLQEQAGFLDVQKDVEWLIEELKWMQSFLIDAELKLDRSKLSQQWKSDIRDLAFKCEDIIDTFPVELAEPKTLPGCLAAIPSCCISYATNPRSTHKLKGKIKRLKSKLNNISSRQGRYELNVNNIATSSSKTEVQKLMDLRRSTPYANNEYMVGQADALHLLTSQLKNGRSCRLVISIIGMGGLGKTTLARKLYDKLHKQYFSSYSWICVSQMYDHSSILLQLIKSMINPSKSDLESLTDTESMESYLYDVLRTRQYLVVLDDLWEREAWEMLQRVLPDNNNGSRIIITSRNVKVVEMNKAYVHKPRYLHEDEGWELFCKKVFPDDMIIPPHIENLGKEMVAKCLGLPLAIVTLGGLLSTKSTTVNEWTLVRDYFWNELEKDSMHINAVLSLSYMDLPDYLKPCFLYVGMFPEDFEIPISKLILLWVAEGFIVSERRSPESVAKSYFDELVGRSLFQKKGEDWFGSTFRVHGLLRDLAIKRAKDEGFSVYHDENQLNNLTDRSLHRRLVAFQPRGLLSRYKNPSLRTLFIGSPEKDVHLDNNFRLGSYKLLRSIHMHYSLLRVIDIHVQGYMHTHQWLPSEIGSLIHLRYICLHMLTTTEKLPVMPELPDTIGNLKALQTFCVTYDVIQPCMALPDTMENLQSLKHLIGNFSLGDWIGKLICLETLQEITYEQWCGIDTTNLVNLRHLSLTNVPQLDVDYPARFYDNFRTTRKLQTLSLENSEKFELASVCVSRIFEYCPEITHFKSSGINFQNSANLHKFAINLEVLDVVYCNNPEEDPVPLFERLTALRALRMKYYSVDVQELVCSREGFPQLRTLDIELGHNVTFSVAESSMPLLANLETNNSANFLAPTRLTT